MAGNIRRTWLSWAAVSLLAVLCGIVAWLQYTWAGELSSAEQQRLQSQLRDRLESVRRGVNQEIASDASALAPAFSELDKWGPETAYAARYAEWKRSHKAVFSRIALAVPQPESLALYSLDLESSRFSPGVWPADWSGIRERLARPPGPPSPDRGGGQEWLILEPNLDYVRAALMPELLERYLGRDYETELVTAPGGRMAQTADASVPLLDGGLGLSEPGRGGRGGPPEPGYFGGPPPGRGFRGPPPGNPSPRMILASQGWLLVARHKAGSLEALVEQTRRRNLAISAGLLLLILTTAAALVRFSRQAQRLAELQFNFVAGVSHELRTPLTVIRTAAFNLHGKLAANPEHVERYGKLIAGESEKLTTMVEQVLLFATARAAAAVRKREPVDVEALIGEVLASSPAALEMHIDPNLPAVLGDHVALKHALRNLVDNALKHGAGADHWIGISASSVAGSRPPAVEIRVADHGPGIPPAEQAHIFDAFFRGRRAIEDQIHGTGLGLDLVRRIVEAHGGSVRVHSVPNHGTEFIVRLPVSLPTNPER